MRTRRMHRCSGDCTNENAGGRGRPRTAIAALALGPAELGRLAAVAVVDAIRAVLDALLRAPKISQKGPGGCVPTEAPCTTDLLWRTLRALNRPGRARTVQISAARSG